MDRVSIIALFILVAWSVMALDETHATGDSGTASSGSGGGDASKTTFHWSLILLAKALTSWTAVYFVIFGPLVCMIANFLFGDCGVASALDCRGPIDHSQCTPGNPGPTGRPLPYNPLKNRLGVLSVWVALLWQYTVRSYGPHHELTKNVHYCDVVGGFAEWITQFVPLFTSLRRIFPALVQLLNLISTFLRGGDVAAVFAGTSNVNEQGTMDKVLQYVPVDPATFVAGCQWSPWSADTGFRLPRDFLYHSLLILIIVSHFSATFYRQPVQQIQRLLGNKKPTDSVENGDGGGEGVSLATSYCSQCRSPVLGMDHHCFFLHNCVSVKTRIPPNVNNNNMMSNVNGGTAIVRGNGRWFLVLLTSTLLCSLLVLWEWGSIISEIAFSDIFGTSTPASGVSAEAITDLANDSGFFYRWVYLGVGFILTLVLILAGGFGLYWYTKLWYVKGTTTLQVMKDRRLAKKHKMV